MKRLLSVSSAAAAYALYALPSAVLAADDLAATISSMTSNVDAGKAMIIGVVGLLGLVVAAFLVIRAVHGLARA